MPDGGEPTPLIADTSGLYARLDADDAHHDDARAFFETIRSGDSPYRPVYVTTHVLAELVTLAMVRLDTDTATRALERLRSSSLVRVLTLGPDQFAAACEAFHETADDGIALTDHITAVAADAQGITHVFGFDDHFRDLGYALVP